MATSITSGMASGLKLDVPKGETVRPTGIRSKRALFDSLGAAACLQGKIVVDLFSGTGALGLEAASRGASEIYLVEKSSMHCSWAEKNIAKISKAVAENSPKIVLLRSDALTVYHRLPQLAKKVDLIFADPPYAKSASYLKRISQDRGFAEWAENAILIWETPGNFRLSFNKKNLWQEENRRKFAGTEFLFLKTVK